MLPALTNNEVRHALKRWLKTREVLYIVVENAPSRIYQPDTANVFSGEANAGPHVVSDMDLDARRASVYDVDLLDPLVILPGTGDSLMERIIAVLTHDEPLWPADQEMYDEAATAPTDTIVFHVALDIYGHLRIKLISSALPSR